MNNYDIYLGKGLGQLRFGMTINEVQHVIGMPDQKLDKESYIRCTFNQPKISLHFETDERKLGWIECGNDKCSLFGQRVFGQKKESVLKLTAGQGMSPTETEYYETFESVSFDDKELELQFEFGDLSRINFGVLFDADGNRNW